MPRDYPIPDTKIAWERVKRALTIYSRAPGANIERINTFLREEAEAIGLYVPPTKVPNYELAFTQLNKYYIAFDVNDWRAYYKYRNECTSEEQEQLDNYMNHKEEEKDNNGNT